MLGAHLNRPMKIPATLSILLALACFSLPVQAQSAYSTCPDDPKAIRLDASAASAPDASAAIQAAIDQAEGHVKEGIVFVPSGRYALTHTVYIWPGVRLFGCGPTRPVFTLPPNTPGFQKGMGLMLVFTGTRRGETNLRPDGTPRVPERVPFPVPATVPPDERIADANSGTFYSALSNIDFEIGDGNPAAVAIRFHVAQHAFLTHMDFRTGSGLAALYQVGNEAEDLHFHGGRYGILTEKTSPAWQFTLIDSTFDGQREAAIREHEAGLTLVRDTFRHVPVAIDIDAGYPDQLWVKDSRFEDVSQAAVIISLERSPLTEIGFENAVLFERADLRALSRQWKNRCSARVPVPRKRIQLWPGCFGSGPDGYYRRNLEGRIDPRSPRAASAGHSRPAADLGMGERPQTRREGRWQDRRYRGPAGGNRRASRALPAHWPLHRPRHPHAQARHCPDRPASHGHADRSARRNARFPGLGAPKPVIFAPSGSRNILSGFGVFTGGINPRAVGVLWKAGEQSLIDDVRFLGGHGSGTNPYNNMHTADPDPHKRWDSQYPSLWVADGGGGVFADIWTPNTFAQEGFVVSDTKTPGHVYELSNEHHLRTEIRLTRVENWDINAPQTEEEAGESPEALSLELDRCRNITIANYHAYRVTRSRAPFPAAVRMYNSSDIHFRNVHVNAESGYAICDENGCSTYLRVSKYPYENAIEDVTHHQQMREREFAVLDIPTNSGRPANSASSANSAAVRTLESGFFSIAGAAVDAHGKLYFVDRHFQRIYGWSQTEGLTVERDNPLDPINLAIDSSGNLLVQSSAGPAATVYSFKPGTSAEELTVLQPQPTPTGKAAKFVFPVNWWNNGEFQDQLNVDTMRFTTLAELFAKDATTPVPNVYISPDGSTLLPARRVFQQGPANEILGWRFSDNLDTHGFIAAAPGDTIYVSSESEDITYRARVQPDGTLADLRPFAQRGSRVSRRRGRRQYLHRQRPDLCLQPRRQAVTRNRRSRAPAAAHLRRPGQKDPLHPRAPRTLRNGDSLKPV